MKKIFYLFQKTCIPVAVAIPAILYGQQATLDSITKKFNAYRSTHLSEKLYLHLDQHFYLTGESMWFSLYYVDGSFHQPLNVSKVAYVEILDKNNTPVLQTKAGLASGAGQGSLFLPATLPSGYYTVRAYTQWMKNFPPEYYFHQVITIVNPFIKPQFDNTAASAVRATFFPEGGHLVQGLTSKVAFQVADHSGKGMDCKGAVINSHNDTLVSFRPLKFGIGNFLFTPQENETYRIVITSENVKKSFYALPPVEKEGYVMALQDTADMIRVSVKARFANRETPYVFLFAHSRNMVAKAQVKFFGSGYCVFTIPKSDLPEGITHLTVFSHDQKPVCERLYFKRPDHHLTVTASTDQQHYNTRRKVVLNIDTQAKQQARNARVSVSVYKYDSLSAAAENIYEYLWMTSDLQGPVESPSYYLFSENAEVKAAADDLMLTHGWRKFGWNALLQESASIEFIPEFRGHLIQGTVRDTDGNPLPNVMTNLSAPGKTIRLYPSRSNANGKVIYETPDLFGSYKLISQATSSSGHGIPRVELQSPFSAQYRKNGVQPFRLSSSLEKLLLDRSVSMQVQDIYYEETATPLLQPKLDTTAFYGKADATYFLDRYTRFPVMEEVLREYVPEVFVRKRKDGFHFIVIDKVKGGVLRDDPMILLDGVPLANADKIMAVDPLRIKKLEVVERNYYLGSLSMPGIVSFTTYQGDIAGIELDPGSVSLNYEGLQLHREFNSPQYPTQKQLESRMPDRRHLVYWNPFLVTSEEGKAQVEFYTSDILGTFQIVIEGISEDGYAGEIKQVFTVK